MLQTQSKEKTDYDTKILDIESKHIITADYNKFTKDIVGNSIKSKSLTDKSDISGFINSAELDKKQQQHQQQKLIFKKKLQAFDSSYF